MAGRMKTDPDDPRGPWLTWSLRFISPTANEPMARRL
jgi:hypothetical protein